jgi:hypothetical protein
MDGMTGPGGVPAWLDEQLGWGELPNQIKELGRLKGFSQEASLGQDQPATGKILGSEPDIRTIDFRRTGPSTSHVEHGFHRAPGDDFHGPAVLGHRA